MIPLVHGHKNKAALNLFHCAYSVKHLIVFPHTYPNYVVRIFYIDEENKITLILFSCTSLKLLT
jgi:hypothetical protein